jgi:hypothetical protein
MRAKIILAAAFCLSAVQPVLADDLPRDVQEILTGRHQGLFGGLFGGGLFGYGRGGYGRSFVGAGCYRTCVTTQPAVLADAGCGATAILTRDPSDLDIRRERLIEKINCLSGRLNACHQRSLALSIQEINNAELAFRCDGHLSNWESRRLYRAMDKVGNHVDRWTGNGTGFGSLIGLDPGFWY